MFGLLLRKVSNTTIILLVIVNFFLWQNNAVLREKNKALLLKEHSARLTTQNDNHIQTIEIQKKVIEVVKNTRSVDLATNIKRMYDNEL